MEYIQGETLERTVETSPLDTATFIEIARQCLDGLSSAHHAGLIHRDLKPANIMLCRLPSGSYQVKILDFGIASFLQDGNPEEAKANDSISGSIHWIAPEQIEGHPATEQSDLYSLGCLFYFALTGLPPFTGKSSEDIAKAHLDHTVRHLSELRKDLTPSMADWIMGLIARNPAARPTRATEALEDFEVISGRRQVSTRAMKLPTIPLEPSEVPVGDSTCSFNFNEIAAAPSVTKPNDPAPQSVSTPSPVAPKADSTKRHWLVLIGCAAILALAGLAWLVTGAKSEPKKTAANVAAGVPILRLHGSNTVGSKMGPSLVQGFLQTKGASQIHTEQGSMPVERRITFLLPKDSAPSLAEVHSHGSRTGFASLANGTCDIAMSSNEVKDEMHEELFKKGIGDMRTPTCEHVIGLDGLAVIIHSTNPVSRLSKDQIADVFSGAIRDWSELGREKGGPIRLYARDANSGTFESFQAMVLGNKTLSPEARRIEDSTELSEGVSNDPDGMGFVGLPYIKNCKAVAVGDGECAPLIPTPFTVATEDYALSRRLYFYSPSTPSHPWVRELVEFSLGPAGQEIVIEEYLVGKEVSVHAFGDGETVALFPISKDHKQIFEDNKGPNTGGMGAYCPTPFVDAEMLADIEARILVPTAHAMRRAKVPFQGVLYAGLMLTSQGPKVLEFNARFGDPECEALLVRMESSLLELLDAAVDRRLDEVEPPRWRDGASVTVVMASDGYPGPVHKGRPIRGLDAAARIPGVEVFHSATKAVHGEVQSNGGRVLAVTAVGPTLARAKLQAYSAVKEIRWPGAWCRKDISSKGLAHERQQLATEPAIDQQPVMVAPDASASSDQTPEPSP
jgi:ABC-type phosphate transport system substrate-binding protein